MAVRRLEATKKLAGGGALLTLICSGVPGQKAVRWPSPGLTETGIKLHQTSQLSEHLVYECSFVLCHVTR